MYVFFISDQYTDQILLVVNRELVWMFVHCMCKTTCLNVCGNACDGMSSQLPLCASPLPLYISIWYWRQAVRQTVELKERQVTNKQSDRRADWEAYRSSEVQRSNHSRQPAQFGLHRVSFAQLLHTASSLYFQSAVPAHPPQRSILLSDRFKVWQHDSGRLFQSSKLWKLSNQLCAFAEQI